MGVVVELPSLEELEVMGAAGLERSLVAVERARRLVESAYVDVIEMADRGRVWADDGHRSVRNWLVALTGVSSVEAARRLQTVRALRDLEVVRAGLRAGDVGVCQVRELARVHASRRVGARLGRVEELLVTVARRRCFDEFHRRVGRWVAAADRVGAERTHDEVHAGRRVRLAWTQAGFSLSAHGGVVQGSQLVEVFAAFVDAEFDADWEAAKAVHGDDVSMEHLARTAAQREFDALCAVFAAACSGPVPGAACGGVVPTVDVVVDAATFEEYLAYAAGGPVPADADPADLSRRCETGRGVPIDPREAVVAASVGYVRRVVLDSAGVVVNMGRRRRLFTGPLREAVWLQGRRCLWPGCEAEAREQDHSVEWADHGHTRTDNAGPACRHHHKWKGRGYTVWRDTEGRWHIIRPDGTELTEPRAA
jgi:hypothetical protein